MKSVQCAEQLATPSKVFSRKKKFIAPTAWRFGEQIDEVFGGPPLHSPVDQLFERRRRRSVGTTPHRKTWAFGQNPRRSFSRFSVVC